MKQWKIVLKTDVSVDRFTYYQQTFNVSNSKDFETAFLPFEDFHQYIEDEINPDEVPLNLANIKTIGLQAFGGVYQDFKQSGPATLEIDHIKLKP